MGGGGDLKNGGDVEFLNKFSKKNHN